VFYKNKTKHFDKSSGWTIILNDRDIKKQLNKKYKEAPL